MTKSDSKQTKQSSVQQSSVRYVSSKTPWGQAQSADEIGPGIIRYSTASHGGYFLNKEANAKVSPILRNSTFCRQGKNGWYEEDNDWPIVVYTFKEYFHPKDYEIALKALELYHGKAWKQLQKSLKK